MLVFDGLLALLILVLAWLSISSRDLFEAIVMFIALGLMIALAWMRLQAPDAALAEAGIGAGLAGALLLSTLSRLARQTDDQLRVLSVMWSMIWLGLAVGLLLALTQLPTTGQGMMPEVLANIDQSGVSHPVTAVLLNYRAWDTALELAVLAWAWFAQQALNRDQRPVFSSLQGQVLITASKMLAPFLVLVGGYLLWRGADAPGGAFQAGAVLAAGLVLYSLATQVTLPYQGWQGLALRILWLAGFWLFGLVGLVGLGLGLSFMGYPPAHAGSLILLIEVFATLTIAFLLAAMFSGVSHGRPTHDQ
jgi:multisubunit Na+/H+ antiporter MnhB subunit